ncbi:MAG: hypothetical protein NXI27_12305 [Alphaproteobacteria bacterium]|nr:hypothetical protein [Alphaproteobacteria bacterium]
MELRVLNYITFVALLLTTALGYWFLWGLILIYWTIPGFYSGRTTLLTDVTREDDQVLYWAVQIAWIAFGALLVVSDIYPDAGR